MTRSATSGVFTSRAAVRTLLLSNTFPSKLIPVNVSSPLEIGVTRMSAFASYLGDAVNEYVAAVATVRPTSASTSSQWCRRASR